MHLCIVFILSFIVSFSSSYPQWPFGNSPSPPPRPRYRGVDSPSRPRQSSWNRFNTQPTRNNYYSSRHPQQQGFSNYNPTNGPNQYQRRPSFNRQQTSYSRPISYSSKPFGAPFVEYQTDQNQFTRLISTTTSSTTATTTTATTTITSTTTTATTTSPTQTTQFFSSETPIILRLSPKNVIQVTPKPSDHPLGKLPSSSTDVEDEFPFEKVVGQEISLDPDLQQEYKLFIEWLRNNRLKKPTKINSDASKISSQTSSSPIITALDSDIRESTTSAIVIAEGDVKPETVTTSTVSSTQTITTNTSPLTTTTTTAAKTTTSTKSTSSSLTTTVRSSNGSLKVRNSTITALPTTTKPTVKYTVKNPLISSTTINTDKSTDSTTTTSAPASSTGTTTTISTATGAISSTSPKPETSSSVTALTLNTTIAVQNEATTSSTEASDNSTTELIFNETTTGVPLTEDDDLINSTTNTIKETTFLSEKAQKTTTEKQNTEKSTKTSKITYIKTNGQGKYNANLTAIPSNSTGTNRTVKRIHDFRTRFNRKNPFQFFHQRPSISLMTTTVTPSSTTAATTRIISTTTKNVNEPSSGTSRQRSPIYVLLNRRKHSYKNYLNRFRNNEYKTQGKDKTSPFAERASTVITTTATPSTSTIETPPVTKTEATAKNPRTRHVSLNTTTARPPKRKFRPRIRYPWRKNSPFAISFIKNEGSETDSESTSKGTSISTTSIASLSTTTPTQKTTSNFTAVTASSLFATKPTNAPPKRIFFSSLNASKSNNTKNETTTFTSAASISGTTPGSKIFNFKPFPAINKPPFELTRTIVTSTRKSRIPGLVSAPSVVTFNHPRSDLFETKGSGWNSKNPFHKNSGFPSTSGVDLKRKTNASDFSAVPLAPNFPGDNTLTSNTTSTTTVPTTLKTTTIATTTTTITTTTTTTTTATTTKTTTTITTTKTTTTTTATTKTATTSANYNFITTSPDTLLATTSSFMITKKELSTYLKPKSTLQPIPITPIKKNSAKFNEKSSSNFRNKLSKTVKPTLPAVLDPSQGPVITAKVTELRPNFSNSKPPLVTTALPMNNLNANFFDLYYKKGWKSTDVKSEARGGNKIETKPVLTERSDDTAMPDFLRYAVPMEVPKMQEKMDVVNHGYARARYVSAKS